MLPHSRCVHVLGLYLHPPCCLPRPGHCRPESQGAGGRCRCGCRRLSCGARRRGWWRAGRARRCSPSSCAPTSTRRMCRSRCAPPPATPHPPGVELTMEINARAQICVRLGGGLVRQRSSSWLCVCSKGTYPGVGAGAHQRHVPVQRPAARLGAPGQVAGLDAYARRLSGPQGTACPKPYTSPLYSSSTGYACAGSLG